MFNLVKQIFKKKKTDVPTLPIKDSRYLSNIEIDYIINKLEENSLSFYSENSNDKEFIERITVRLTNNLRYKIPFLEIELAYLNAILKNKKKMKADYKLFHQLKENDSTELTNMLINQGYSFVPTVGYLKIS